MEIEMAADDVTPASRSAVSSVRHDADIAEFCLREFARKRGDLPGRSFYTNEQLIRWGSEAAERAFRNAAQTFGAAP